jgi:hypothetical protein
MVDNPNKSRKTIRNQCNLLRIDQGNDPAHWENWGCHRGRFGKAMFHK